MDEIAYRRRVFAILYVGTFMFRLAFGLSHFLAIAIVSYLFWKKIGIPAIVAIALVSFAISFSFIEGLFAGVTGYATDILDARIVLLLSSLIASLSMIIYIAAGIFYAELWFFLIVLMLGHAIHGIASSFKVTPTLAIISRFTVYEERAKMMGIYDMVLMYGRISGLALGGVVYAIFVGHDGNPLEGLKGFIILFILFVAVGLMFYVGLPHIPPERKGKVSHLWSRLFSHIGAGAKVMFGGLRRDLGLTWFMLACLWGLAFTLGPFILLIDFGIDVESSGFISAIITLFIGGTSPFWGLVADKIGRKKTATIGVLGLLITVILAIVAIKIFGISYKDIKFYIILAPGIFCLASIGPSFLGRLGDTAIAGERGIVSSGFQFVTSMGEVTGIVVGGIGYVLAHEYLVGTSYAPLSGIIGVGIPGLFFFFATIFFGLRLKHDEVVLREIQELMKRKSVE